MCRIEIGQVIREKEAIANYLGICPNSIEKTKTGLFIPTLPLVRVGDRLFDKHSPEIGDFNAYSQGEIEKNWDLLNASWKLITNPYTSRGTNGLTHQGFKDLITAGSALSQRIKNGEYPARITLPPCVNIENAGNIIDTEEHINGLNFVTRDWIPDPRNKYRYSITITWPDGNMSMYTPDSAHRPSAVRQFS